MSSIVQFAARARPSRERTACEMIAPCEVIIFPGVRYERWAEPAEQKQTPKPKRKRARKARPRAKAN